jgi:hypothetical protein
LCSSTGESPCTTTRPSSAAPKADDTLRPGDMNLLYNMKSVPAALMSAALNEQDLL